MTHVTRSPPDPTRSLHDDKARAVGEDWPGGGRGPRSPACSGRRRTPPGFAEDTASELLVKLKGGKKLGSIDLTDQPEIHALLDVVDVDELTT